jgi:hypothetical protein
MRQFLAVQAMPLAAASLRSQAAPRARDLQIAPSVFTSGMGLGRTESAASNDD